MCVVAIQRSNPSHVRWERASKYNDGETGSDVANQAAIDGITEKVKRDGAEVGFERIEEGKMCWNMDGEVV